MPKLLNLQLWGKANIYAIYEVSPVNNVAKIPIHRLIMLMMTMQDNANDDANDDTTAQLNILSWPKSVKRHQYRNMIEKIMTYEIYTVLPALNPGNRKARAVATVMITVLTGLIILALENVN